MESRQVLLSLVLSVIGIATQVNGGAWSYSGDTGPDHWAATYPACGGQSQSPIDIVRANTVYDSTLGSFTFVNYDKPVPGNFTVTNNGHSVQVTVPSGSGITIKGTNLPNTYTLAQFHFHWGNNNSFGSEHSLDKIDYPMEIHLVHYNSDLYPDLSTAASQPNGLAVLGIFVVVSDLKVNPAIESVIDVFPEIPYEDESTTMPSLAISSLLPASISDFYRYSGSLTTPACYESVIWTVFRTKVSVTTDEIVQFRTQLHSNLPGDPDETLVDNARPPQPLNGRVVNKSF